MAENEQPEKEGFFRKVFDEAAVAVGLKTEVSDEAIDTGSPSHVGNIPAPPPSSGVAQATSVLDDQATDLSAKIEKIYQSELQDTLASASPTLANYFEQRQVMKEALGVGLSGDQLEDAATRAALKVTKLTAGEIESSFAALKDHRKQSRTDFNANQNQKRESEVDAPRRQTAETEKAIKALEQQVADLGIEITQKRSSIGPVLERVAAMEIKISNAGLAYDKAEAKVDASLDQMKQSLLGILGK